MSSDPTKPNLCQASRKDGAPCTAPSTRGGQWCIGHDPALEETRQQARRKGGHHASNAARAAKLLPARLRPLLELLEESIQQVHSGTLQPSRAQAMASLSNSLIKVFQCSELEERLRVLEKRE